MSTEPLSTLRALADPVRWQLVQALAEGPRTTGTLAAGFDQTRFGVMKHLEVLLEAGLITVERRGRERWNHLNPVPLAAVLQAITTPLGRDWSARLLALGRAVRERESPMTAPRMIEIRQQIPLPAPPARVFEVFVTQIDLWWTAPYRLTEGGRITLDARIGGDLREEGAQGHVAVWGKVDEVAPGRILGLTGTFGMQTAVTGRVRITLEAVEGGTDLTLSHIALGPIAEGADQRYSAGWADLLGTRLRARLAP